MARADHLHEASPAYAGVLAEWGADMRLIVTARGAQYALQECDAPDDFIWRRVRVFPNAAALRAYVSTVLIDPPAAFGGVIRRLPDIPRDCGLVPFGVRVAQ